MTSILPEMTILYVIASDPRTITLIQRVGFAISESGSFHSATSGRDDVQRDNKTLSNAAEEGLICGEPGFGHSNPGSGAPRRDSGSHIGSRIFLPCRLTLPLHLLIKAELAYPPSLN